MRVAIAEDSFIVRTGLVEILTDRGHDVVCAVGDGQALLDAVREHQPDVAVIDIRMPPTHTDEGLRAAIQIRTDHPRTGILVFSQYIETRYASQLLTRCSGRGVGYLLKDRVANIGEFHEALNRIAAGGTALDPEVVTQLLGASHRTNKLATLTPRERKVIELIAEGRSNAAIGKALSITDSATEKHIANIFLKLDLDPSADDNRRVLAVLMYIRN